MVGEKTGRSAAALSVALRFSSTASVALQICRLGGLSEPPAHRPCLVSSGAKTGALLIGCLGDNVTDKILIMLISIHGPTQPMDAFGRT